MKKDVPDIFNLHGVQVCLKDLYFSSDRDAHVEKVLNAIHQKNSAIDLTWAKLEIKTRFNLWLKNHQPK
jgi:hypothetical protein